jgi:hypothetical protein
MTNPTDCKSNGEYLYPVNCDGGVSPVKPIVETGANLPKKVDSNTGNVFLNYFSQFFTLVFLDSVVYYLSLFVLVWSVFYFIISVYNFRYIGKSTSSLKYKSEFEAYEYIKTAKRVFQTLFAFLCIGLVYVSLGYMVQSLGFGVGVEYVVKIIFFVMALIPAFLFKLWFDMSYIKAFSSLPTFAKVKYLGYQEQMGMFANGVKNTLNPAGSESNSVVVAKNSSKIIKK